jgi:(p)ppGpp synthase/HD superfamily hydrolase
VVDQPSAPTFVLGSDLLEAAYRFALEAHHGPSDEAGTAISHPVAVAGLLAEAGFDEDVVAAALLHDVVEDTALGQEDILANFQDRIAGLVSVMTEDESIPDYGERKAEHRDRVLDAGHLPASIYLADKLARVRRYVELDEPVEPQRLEHYRTTVEQFSSRDGELPFLPELQAELPELRAAGG